MGETQKKKSIAEVKKAEKVNFALCCDKYVDGKDRICGYIVVKDGVCTGNLSFADIERFLKAGELKVIKPNNEG